MTDMHHGIFQTQAPVLISVHHGAVIMLSYSTCDTPKQWCYMLGGGGFCFELNVIQ